MFREAPPDKSVSRTNDFTCTRLSQEKTNTTVVVPCMSPRDMPFFVAAVFFLFYAENRENLCKSVLKKIKK